MKIQRCGHAMFLITSDQGLRLLLDPYISGNSSVIPDLKDPQTLKLIDALLVSHGHIDHAGGVSDVAAVNPEVHVFCSNDLSYHLISQGARNVHRLDIGGTEAFRGISVTLVGAAHGSSFGKDRVPCGAAGGFVIRLETGFTIYYSGDSGLSGDMKLVIGDYFKPDLAILSAGGVFSMDAEQAAYAAGELIRPRAAIPCHYFPPVESAPDPATMAQHFKKSAVARGSVDTPVRFAAALAKYPHVKAVTLDLGQTQEFRAS